MAVTVAGREVHFPDPRSLPELLIDQADGFEEVGPVDGGNEPHARDHVAHRHVGRDLLVVLEPHDLVGTEPLRLDPLHEPGERRSLLRIAFPQPLQKMNREWGGKRLALESPQPRFPRFSRLGADAEQRVGEGVCVLARKPPSDDSLCQPAQVLDQDEPQRDGDRPELAHRQRLRSLVCRDEPPQRVRFEPAVSMRDEVRGQSIDAWIAGERTGVELGKLPVVPRRKVLPDLTEVFFDDVEVVDEPFRRGRDRALFPDRVGDRAIGLEEDASVLFQPWKERFSLSKTVRETVLGPQPLRELLQVLGRIELRANRLFEAGKGEDRVFRFVRRHVSVVSAAESGASEATSRRSARGRPRREPRRGSRRPQAALRNPSYLRVAFRTPAAAAASAPRRPATNCAFRVESMRSHSRRTRVIVCRELALNFPIVFRAASAPSSENSAIFEPAMFALFARSFKKLCRQTSFEERRRRREEVLRREDVAVRAPGFPTPAVVFPRDAPALRRVLVLFLRGVEAEPLEEEEEPLSIVPSDSVTGTSLSDLA